MFRNWGKKKAAKTTASTKTMTSAKKDKIGSSMRPFDKKDERAKILIRTVAESPNALLECLQNDAGQEKSTLVLDKEVNMEITASTLSLSNHHIVGYPPRRQWSRMRNYESDAWEKSAHNNADAYVYYIDVENADEYLSGSKSRYVYQAGWEQDREQLSRMMRSNGGELLKNPSKPLLLAVNTNGQDDFDVERLVNLLGLAGNDSSLQRPVRVISFSPEADPEGAGDLMESFEWLATMSKNLGEDDQATAMTAEDDSSIMTSNTKGTEGQAIAGGQEEIVTSEGSPGHYILDYEPTLLGGNPTLQRFEPIKNGTFCPFAKAAKLWGGKSSFELDNSYSPDSNPWEMVATMNAGPLMQMVERVNNGEKLDGFCLELPSGHGYGNVTNLGKAVKTVLSKLAELDPSGENAMKMCPIGDTKWRFRFAGEDFFLTTFAPAYDKTSSRYSFGVWRAFILFQPLTSFGRHGLTQDTPASATRWTNPTSMRDKARVAFRDAGCPYHIPETLPYPVAEHVVKHTNDNGTNVVRWWEMPDEKVMDFDDL